MAARATIRKALSRGVKRTGERESGHLPPAYSQDAFAQFKAMVDRGTHGAQGLQARDRVAAMAAMESLAVRDPRRLAEILNRFDQGSAVRELIAFSLSRR